MNKIISALCFIIILTAFAQTEAKTSPSLTANTANNSTVPAPIPPLMVLLNKQAPEWIYPPLERLAAAGLINPDSAGLLSDRNLSRREAAILTARAYNLRRQNSTATNAPQNTYDDSHIQNPDYTAADEDIRMLMNEFAVELSALGYGEEQNAFTQKATAPVDRSLKIHGEIRYNIMSNSSNQPRYDWNDNRIRTRIYMDRAINDSWTVHGMIESDKSFSNSDDNNYYTHDKDGRITFDRYYISGKTDLFNMPFNVEAGATSAYLADGNILDSDFKGIKLSTFGPDDSDKSTLYSAGYGNVNDTQRLLYAEIYHKTNKNIDYMSGFYHWNNYGSPTTIYSSGINYYISNYTLGLKYFKASENDGSGASDGYVLSAKYGYNRSWVPGTYEIAAYYYDMAGTTYITHTMSGLGSYMNGFKGYSAGWYYTLMPNVLLGVEYYDLKDKTSSDRVKTWWSQISYGF